MLEKIKKVLADQLGVDESKITPNSKIVEDLGADSLDVVELLMNLEEEYGISVSEDEATKISTVGDFVALVESKMNK
ncbi:MAG: acyl carrier protein [Clostridia bacterium]|nr:acyl carrier protein [Clostridia bacterium]